MVSAKDSSNQSALLILALSDSVTGTGTGTATGTGTPLTLEIVSLLTLGCAEDIEFWKSAHSETQDIALQGPHLRVEGIESLLECMAKSGALKNKEIKAVCTQHKNAKGQSVIGALKERRASTVSTVSTVGTTSLRDVNNTHTHSNTHSHSRRKPYLISEHEWARLSKVFQVYDIVL